MVITKSAKLFTERVGIRPTFRSPVPTLFVTANDVYNVELEAPLPIPEAISNGSPPPDRGLTKEPWPSGVSADDV